MRKATELSIQFINECFSYNPETGEVHWKKRPRHHFKSEASMNRANGQQAGKLAGSDDGSGYIRISISLPVEGRKVVHLRAHRIAFVIHYGRWPLVHIDHINNVKNDNRISNLRECDDAQNIKNSKRRSTNTVGLKGVTFISKTNRFRAQIVCDYKLKFLGEFATAEEAHAAYCKAATELHGEFANHGKAT